MMTTIGSLVYDTTMTKQYRRAASVLVVRSEENGSFRILLVHKPRKRDAWQLPQGGIEEGETVGQAGLRELKEETGIEIPSILFESDAEYRYDFSKGFLRRFRPKNAGQALFFVVAEAPNDVVVNVDKREIDTFAWVEPERIGAFVRRREYLDIIHRLLREYRDHRRV